MCVRGCIATFLAGIPRLPWLPQPGGGQQTTTQQPHLRAAWMGPTKKTPAGHSFVHVHPACTDQLSLLVSPPLNSSSPPSLNEHSYAFDRVDERRTYLLLLPSDYLLCCVPAPLFLLFTNIVSPRDKPLLNKWGLPTAPAHRTTRTVLLHTTGTTRTTLPQHPTTCQPDSRCDYWAAWTSQCIRKFCHLLSLGYF